MAADIASGSRVHLQLLPFSIYLYSFILFLFFFCVCNVCACNCTRVGTGAGLLRVTQVLEHVTHEGHIKQSIPLINNLHLLFFMASVYVRVSVSECV